MAGNPNVLSLLQSIPLPPEAPSRDASRADRTLPAYPPENAADRTSIPRLLKACASSSALFGGRQLHALSVKLRLSSDLYVQTSLVSMYSSCALPDHALRVFDRMPHRNIVAWTAALDACLRSGRPQSVLSTFRQMLESLESCVALDTYCLVSVLSACADLGALASGRAAHAYVAKAGMELTAFLGTALVDMYCKSGSVDDAVKVFDSMPRRARVVQTWNAMLHGLAMHGLGAEAVRVFTETELDGAVRPNEVTFIALLCGCAHAGLVRDGMFYFDEMRRYGIKPNVKHYGCLVDLLGRAGLLDDAYRVAMTMDVPPNQMVWGALLSACRMHGDVDMGELVMERILNEDCSTEDTSHYVVMSNMYRKAGLGGKMAKVRAMVGKKPKARSWIEIAGNTTEFGVGIDASSHSMWREIKGTLEEMDVRLAGEASLEDMENPHSEKVALAFGLIRTEGPIPIRISKNLRICENCHDLMKSVSGVYGREIIVRDCNRFHRFKGGLCSCNDYW